MATKKQAINIKKVSKPAVKTKQMQLKDIQSIAPMFTTQSLIGMMQDKLATVVA